MCAVRRWCDNFRKMNDFSKSCDYYYYYYYIKASATYSYKYYYLINYLVFKSRLFLSSNDVLVPG